MDYMSLKLLSSTLLPPLNLLLLGTLGLVMARFRRAGGLALLIASMVGLFLLSMPAVGTALAGLLENRHVDRTVGLEGAQAIVSSVPEVTPPHPNMPAIRSPAPH